MTKDEIIAAGIDPSRNEHYVMLATVFEVEIIVMNNDAINELKVILQNLCFPRGSVLQL